MRDTILLHELNVSTKYSREHLQNIEITQDGIIDYDIYPKDGDLELDMAIFLVKNIPKFDSQLDLVAGYVKAYYINKKGEYVLPILKLEGFSTYPDDRFYGFSIKEIERIVVVMDERADIPYINFYTKPDFHIEKEQYFTQNLYLKGYYKPREFAGRKHIPTNDFIDPDLRSTIYWNPTIVTNENGEAEITYYNADPKTNVRIDVEGIGKNGEIVVGQYTYKVE